MKLFISCTALLATLSLCADAALIEVPKFHPGTQVTEQGVTLSVRPCSYQECKKQFAKAVKTTDELEQEFVILKVVVTNPTDTRYLLHNRTVDLPTVSYAELSELAANKQWRTTFLTETLLNAFDIAIIPAMVYLLIEKEQWFKHYLTVGGLFGGFAALKTAKERAVRKLHAAQEETKARLKLIKHQLRTPSPLADHAVIEPRDSATKLLIVKRGEYQENFTVSLMSHDYTATPHTIDFNVTLPLDKMRAVALLAQK